ncbi:hypothetical protein ETU08_05600 [Apibacter muscae]|uniref:endonuclease/exonuclease/phosphatase family protein n=1 Tax=Apibacter muscae TaxID=2509004 RepID=UPI0011AD038F|nr:endonuclease/exonuclease/phosphatase family protein [Apibacter muscae]TWP30032.1 hypothetical protein ETU08_05600 [Apibacter muscae]
MIFIKRRKSSYIYLIIHSIVAILLVSVYVNRFITPKDFPYFGIVALIFPILVLLHLLFTFVWLIKKEMIFIPFLVLTFLLLFPVKKYIHFGNQKNLSLLNESDKKEELKVLTYNLRYANGNRDLESLEKFIKSKDVDVAFFQEIYTRQWRSKEVFLVDRYNAVFDLVGISSKYPIIDKQKIILPDQGYACMADILKGSDTIRCINIYLEPMYLNKSLFKFSKIDEAKDQTKIVTEKLVNGFKKHQKQLELLTKYIRESPHPTIVCGDMNSVPLSYEYFTMLNENLIDVFETKGQGLGLSFYDYFYPIRIDYIFTNNKFMPISCYVDRTVHFSDHYPVFATMKLNP